MCLCQYIIVANEAADLLSDAIHFQCLSTHTHWSSFDMYTIPEGSGWVGLGWEQVFVAFLLPGG